ncbi:MAG TPA: hypothetical protein PKL31_14870 [Fulvivirga sp.]|nr:hypothetical protein [Fulvivirga sp.]
MKKTITLLLVFLTTWTFAQETGTYQADSVYKSNKVKLRKWYSGTNKKGGRTMYYDREGRLTKNEVELNLGATKVSTYYIYDQSGRLNAMVDSTKNSEPDKKQVKELKKMGINPQLILRTVGPELEVSKYELEYDGDDLIKQTKFNPNGSIDFIVHIDGKRVKEIKDWYRNGSVYRQDTTEFITQFHKAKYYGWQLNNGTKLSWNYRFEYKFDERGRVLSYTRFDGEVEKETATFTYDSNGLLIETSGYAPNYFEYEYYD